MTVEKLQQLFYLEKLISMEQSRLEALREAADIKSPALTTMPRAPGARDRLGEIVPLIVDREQEIEDNIRKYEEARNCLLDFISHVPNARIKLIMILRFVEQKTWQDVADTIGGKETEYSVKHIVYRYLETTE